MNYSNLRLKTKFNIAAIAVLFGIFATLGLVIYQTEKRDITADIDDRMRSHLDDLYTLLNDQVNLKQQVVNVSLHLAENIVSEAGKLEETSATIEVSGVDQVTKVSKNYRIPVWKINGVPLYNNTDLVDRIKDKSVETATIFQKISDGYLRISTNVIKKDGQRAVGAFIPNSAEVIQRVEKGETYYGRAFVVDDWYITAYKPIFINGQVKGILYVGQREKDYAFLKNVFANKKYYSGYPYLISKTGDVVIHPDKEGENLSDQPFFKQLLDAKPTDYKFRYRWPDNEEGKWKYQYFKYFEPYQSYVCVTVYESDMNAAITKLMVIVSLSVLGGIILMFFALNIILTPIVSRVQRASEFAQRISEGKLYAELNDKNRDEIGQLSAAMEAMAAKLRTVVSTILSGSESILSASMQMSSTAIQMAQGAAEQASSTEEVSTSMEQISANVQQNKENAQVADGIATKGASQIIVSNEAASSNIDSMKEIAEKVSIITDIAFQTNILALNAAVEAARAGEHGRGFAVVATEVRRLAERSKIAAGEIERISTTGVSKSIAAGEMLSAVIPDIQRTARLVQEIAAASVEQSTGSQQVNMALQQLNSVTQQNAAASEEMASSAEELSSQAEQLRDAVSYFQMGEERQSSSSLLMNNSATKLDLKVKFSENGNRKTDSKNRATSSSGLSNKGVEIPLVTSGDAEFERF